MNSKQAECVLIVKSTCIQEKNRYLHDMASIKIRYRGEFNALMRLVGKWSERRLWNVDYFKTCLFVHCERVRERPCVCMCLFTLAHFVLSLVHLMSSN